MRKNYQTDSDNAGWWKTALFWLGITLLLTLIPEVYSMFGKPGARVFSFIIMLAVVIVLVVFLLRNLFSRIHDDDPDSGDLKFTVIASIIGFIVAFIIALILTAILLFAFRVELSPEPGFGAETIGGMVIGALLFAPLFCLPIATLYEIEYSRKFWVTYGRILKKSVLPLFGIAVVCLAAGAAIGAFIPGVFGIILSTIVTTGMLVGAGEWTINKLKYG